METSRPLDHGCLAGENGVPTTGDRGTVMEDGSISLLPYIYIYHFREGKGKKIRPYSFRYYLRYPKKEYILYIPHRNKFNLWFRLVMRRVISKLRLG
jgi:hypothetical protein